jgi:hypothetical protein
MHRLNRILALFLVVQSCAMAQSPGPMPGEYLREGGSGYLKVEPVASGTASFSLDSVGANGHQCSLEGEIAGTRATLEAAERDQPCIVELTRSGSGVQVRPVTAEACRHFCGARAGFDGLYLKPRTGCMPEDLSGRRNQFQQLYAAKRYSQGRRILETVVRDCARTLYWLEEAEIRNDLAVAQYHAGDPAACRRTLAKLEADAARTDEALAEAYPPVEWDAYQPIIKAARFNIDLCSARKTARN